MTSRTIHHTLLGVCVFLFVLATYGTIDLGMNIPRWSDTVRMNVSGLLALGVMFWLGSGMLTFSELVRQRQTLPPIWRNVIPTVGGSILAAIVYPLVSGRFGWAFVGILAVGAFAVLVEVRRRMMVVQFEERSLASIEELRKVVRQEAR